MVKVDVTLYTTPDSFNGSPTTAILDTINKAKHSIDFGMFAFTNVQIADALIAAFKRGLSVRGVMDATQSITPGNKYSYLKAASLDVRLYGHPRHLLHDKVILIDSGYPRLARLGLGSMNATEGGETGNVEVWAMMSGTQVTKTLSPIILAQLSLAYQSGRDVN